jgi:hypothetical protein
MEAIAEKSIRERLAETDMPATVQVPAHLAPYMTDAEALATLSTDSIVGEAQRAMRLLVPPGTATHAESAALAEPVMGPANFYTLCHAKAQVDMLTLEDRLELLAIMGAVTASMGHPVVDVDVADALTPRIPVQPAPGERYVTRYLNERGADQLYFDQLKMFTDNMEHKLYILDVKAAFMEGKYHGATPGCFEATPLTHPIHEWPSAEAYWASRKPANYKQREGTQPVVWSCKQ